MLILALAHAQKSGDKSLISRHYNLLLKWAEFLVKRSLDLNELSGISAGRINPALQNKES